MFQASVAEREKVKLMIGVEGPSGSGKTLSSLKLAYGIAGDWSRIAVADTENCSALYYAGEQTGDWLHIPFNPEYDPDRFVEVIKYAESLPIDVLIIDSISHEWTGVGGCLDQVGKFNGASGWKVITPKHDAFIDKMRHSKLHVIATMRSKQEYIYEQNSKGRTVPQKVGMASVQRDGVDYEFGIMFTIDVKHNTLVTKDRTGKFIGKPPFKITEETGKELLSWSNSGTEEPKDEIYQKSHDQREILKNLFDLNKIEKVEHMKEVSEYCSNEKVRMSQIPNVISEFLAKQEGVAQ